MKRMGKKTDKTFMSEALKFKYGPKDKTWDGLNTNIDLRKNFVFFTGHDILMFLIGKFSDKINEYDVIDFHTAEKSLRKQTFVHTMRTEVKIPGCFPHGTVYGFHAPKKKVLKYFKQNINRFKVRTVE